MNEIIHSNESELNEDLNFVENHKHGLDISLDYGKTHLDKELSLVEIKKLVKDLSVW